MSRGRPLLRHRQRGVALVLIVVGLLAVLAMAGLALDASHMGYNKARLHRRRSGRASG